MKKVNPIFSDAEMLYCSVPVPSINDNKGGDFDFTAEQIASYGQSQTHPSIVYIPNGWNGHKYWLATTPYPHSVGVFENPCIYYGDEVDGEPPRVFTPINGVASGEYSVINNPIVKVPNNQALNSDPDIWIDDNNKMWIISRDNKYHHAPYAQSSLNGQAWTPRGNTPLWLCSTGNLQGKPEFVSPAIVKIGDKIKIYSLSGSAGLYGVNYRTNKGLCWGLWIMEGTTFENGGDFAYTGKAAILGKIGIEPWHMDMFVDSRNGNIYMICSARNILTDSTDVYLAESVDGLNFELFSKPLLASKSHYRPSAAIRGSDNMLIVYWSVVTAPTDPSYYPNGASDVPVDGRAIGLSYRNFDEILAELKDSKVVGYLQSPLTD